MKGLQCPACGANKAKSEKGALHCAGCGAVTWTQFDQPFAGKSRKGSTCHNCGNQSIHPVGDVAGARVSRCSKCGVTFVQKA